MKKYEVMYILRSNLEQEALKNEIQNVTKMFTDQNAKVLEVKEWGLRDLAYEIEHMHKGYYVVMQIESEPSAIADFNRVIGYNENIIRHIIVNLE